MESEMMEPTLEQPPVEMVTEPMEPELPPEPIFVTPLDVTDRLAADFLALAEEFPQVVSPADLPDCVLDTAATEGIPLLDAFLRYRWQEEKKVASATIRRRQAAMSSAGSLSRGAVETPPEQDAFLRAFRSAL